MTASLSHRTPRRLGALLALGLLALLPRAARAEVSWDSGCDPGRWTGREVQASDRVQRVDDGRPEGMPCAIRFTVKPGDRINCARCGRSELVYDELALPELSRPHSADHYYRWRSFFPSDFPTRPGKSDNWQVFTQWHHRGLTGSPPLQLSVLGDDMAFCVNKPDRDGNDAKPIWRIPLERGRWHDFILHVRFPENLLELWYDGQKVLSTRSTPVPPDGYLKQGLYRTESITPVATVYHSGMKLGLVPEDVGLDRDGNVGAGPPEGPAPALLWTGNFDKGDFSQWSNRQSAAPDRLALVKPPQPFEDNTYALKATVAPGDLTSNGNRAQLVRGKPETEGAEVFYRWATLFPTDYPTTPQWQSLVTWNHTSDVGSPPIQLITQGEELQLRVSDGEKVLWRTKLERGSWHDFALHVRFSDDPGKGFVELWYDGEPALVRTAALTRASDYLKLGLNRQPGIPQQSTVLHAGMVQGRTLASVVPVARGGTFRASRE